MLIRRFTPQGPVDRNSDLPLVLIHINKTAGTSFSHVLFDLFEHDEIAPAYRGDFSAVDIGAPGLRLYHGPMRHADWYRNGVPALPICMLRDPEARLVSQYKSFSDQANARDAKRWANHQENEEALELARNGTFDDFVLSENRLIKGHCNNLQVQFLSTSGRARSDEDAATAIKALEEHFFYFGITEAYEQSLGLLSWQLNDRDLPQLEARNISREVPVKAVSAAAKAHVKEYTRLDKKLYKAAKRLFEKRLKHISQTMS